MRADAGPDMVGRNDAMRVQIMSAPPRMLFGKRLSIIASCVLALAAAIPARASPAGPVAGAALYRGNISINANTLLSGFDSVQMSEFTTGRIATSNRGGSGTVALQANAILTTTVSNVFTATSTDGEITLPFIVSTNDAARADAFNAFLASNGGQGAIASGVADLGFTGSGGAAAAVLGAVSVAGTGLGALGSVPSLAAATGFDAEFACNANLDAGCGFNAWTIFVAMPLSFTPDANGVYVWTGQLALSAGVNAGFDAFGDYLPGSASAYIDPIISVNPAFGDASALTVTLPAGVPNTTAAPEPDSWALMITGFALTGLVRRRRSRPSGRREVAPALQSIIS